MEGVMNKKPDRSYLQHQQQTLNLLSHDITVLNPNNEFSKPSRWDCSSQGTHISQSKLTVLSTLSLNNYYERYSKSKFSYFVNLSLVACES